MNTFDVDLQCQSLGCITSTNSAPEKKTLRHGDVEIYSGEDACRITPAWVPGREPTRRLAYCDLLSQLATGDIVAL